MSIIDGKEPSQSKGAGYRIVVCIDVSANSAADAYELVTALLAPIDELSYHTTNEWYGPDGEALTQEEITTACNDVFVKRTTME